LPTGDLEKNFGRREAGTTKKIYEKIAHVFGDTPPIKKKGGESIFEGIFRFEKKFWKILATKGGNEGTTECGNNGMKEHRNEGTTECRYYLGPIQKPGWHMRFF
jgi:hypothetical protein